MDSEKVIKMRVLEDYILGLSFLFERRKIMNNGLAIGLGIGTFALGCAAVAVLEGEKVSNIDDKFSHLVKGLEYIEDNVNLNIPEEVAKEMARKAAQQVAVEQVKRASDSAMNDLKKEIHSQVKAAIAKEYDNITPLLKDKLEKEINVQTIARIEEKVSSNVAKQILNNYAPNFGSGTTKADIAKACIDSGMDGFDVARVMSSLK